MKKVLAILLVCAMLVSLAACGNTGGSETQASGTTETPSSQGGSEVTSTRRDKITVAINADPEHLKPYNGNGNPKHYFYNNIYEALFDYDNDHNLVPCIGKNITIVDSTHYQVEIYDCVYDSNGNHITADDVVYSINWLVSEGEAVKFEIFDSIEKVDDYTIQYTWASEPTTWDDLEFPLTRCWIFSQKEMEAHSFATDPVGTGPYTVKSYTPGSSLVLVANDDYWLLKQPELVANHSDLRRANVTEIEFKVIAEAAQAQIALEQGTVDYCEYIQTIAMDEFTEGGQYADKYNAETTEQGDYYYLRCNMYTGHAGADINFRKAIWYAIDSTAVAKAMGGQYAPMNTLGNSAYPDFWDGWNDEQTIMNTYDPELAKEYLEKSTYDGEELTLICQNLEGTTNAAVMIQSLLEQIGVKIKIESLTNTLAQTTEADPTTWDISISSIGGTSLTGAYNRMMGGQQYTYEGQDYTLFYCQDEKLQTLYETAKADATHDTEHLDELIKYATEEMGYLYALAELSTAVVYTKDITNLYIRENTAANFAVCEYAGYTAEHSDYEIVTAEMPEASELADNVYQFTQIYNPEDGAGMIWTLTINDDESWNLKLESTKEDILAEPVYYSGDKTFYQDETNPYIVTTTPPQESDETYKSHGSFYEDDGVCRWELMGNHGMVPINYEDYETYKADWAAKTNTFVYKQIFNPEDGAGMIWKLTINDDESWNLNLSSTKKDILAEAVNYSGDKTFYQDETNPDIVTTTPPMESDETYKQFGSFYESDGVCYWVLDRVHGTMTPKNVTE